MDTTRSLGRQPQRLLLTPEEVAQAVQGSRARLYELLARNDIKSLKIGRSRRVPVAEVQRWIDQQLAAQGHEPAASAAE